MDEGGRSCGEARRYSRELPVLLFSALLVACEVAHPHPQPLLEPLREPPPEPIDAESAGLGISLEVTGLGPLSLKVLSAKVDRPDVVFFVRLEAGEELKDLSGEHVLIPSTFVNGDNAYLLNARPGKYVAVATLCARDLGPSTAHWKGLSFEWDDGKFQECNYFSRSMIEKSATTVEAGSLTFMGSYAADRPFTFGSLDELQMQFQNALEKRGGDEFLPFRLKLRGVDKDRTAEIAFYNQARQLLKDTAWARIVERSMTGLECAVSPEQN